MSQSIQYNTGSSLLKNVMADVNALMGGPSAASTSATGAGTNGSGETVKNGQIKEILSQIGDLLKSVSKMLGEDEGASTNKGAASSTSTTAEAAISGTGRIWGDPHFIGQDGDKYDVQGEAGKSYNLLSDKNFQMNGKFEKFGNDGATVVGKMGIAAGSDQIDVAKDGAVSVNGKALKEGDTVALANGGSVKYGDGKVSIDSGEWKTDVAFQGSGDNAYLNIDVKTENAIADGVKPHGLLGQTFDADSDVRKGDEGSGAQGGGAIEGSNGNITDKGDKSSVGLYEVEDIHDRNFETFNQFFDDAEFTAQSGTAAENDAMQSKFSDLMASAFSSLGQSMLLFMQGEQSRALSKVA